MKQTCKFCNAELVFFAKSKDRQYGKKELYYDAYLCPDCDTIFQLPIPKSENFIENYPSNYYAYQSNQSPRLIHRYLLWSLGKMKFFDNLNILAKYLFPYFYFFRSGENILDIGCGNGRFLDVMKAFGKKTYGFDPDVNATHVAQKKGHAVFSGSSIIEAKYDDNYFDIITMFQVIEHLEDPELYMQEIKRILKPGGLLIVETPNAFSHTAFKYKANWRGLELPRHLILFSPKSLDRILRKYLFDNVHISTRHAPSDLYGSIILMKTSTKENSIYTKLPRLIAYCLLLPSIIWRSVFQKESGGLLVSYAIKKE